MPEKEILLKIPRPHILLAALFVAACSLPPVLGEGARYANIRDGEYVGEYSDFPNGATVRVVVKDGRIAECEVVDTDGVFKETGAETEIPSRIIEKQSTDVDAVSGATNLSRVIMNAAQKALDQATSPEEP